MKVEVYIPDTLSEITLDKYQRYIKIQENNTDENFLAIKMIEKGHKENNPYKILLLDLRMPIMDGYEVINIHQQRNWDLPHIIVVTACILDEDRKKCQQVNVEYFINKPSKFCISSGKFELNCIFFFNFG